MDKIIHMVPGDDETSYARNSSHQRMVAMRVEPIRRRCIGQIIGDMNHLPDYIRVGDLGCSSGPNLFVTAEHIIESFVEASQMSRNINHQKQIKIQYYLNDLYSNDFNLVFKGLPEFYEKLEKKNGSEKLGSKCLVGAMPGSFYGKLFPDTSMMFLQSSYCLHWLSQVPVGLVADKNSIFCENTSSPKVHQAYLDQFTQDFTLFLRMRAQEMVQHGQLFLVFLCKTEEEVEGSHFLSMLRMALTDMVAEGHITEEKLESFNLPCYMPSVHETQTVVESEGSFTIQIIDTFKTRLDDSYESHHDDGLAHKARYVATYMRAVLEPIIAAHFGNGLFMDDLFRRYAEKLEATIDGQDQGIASNMVISLRKE